MNSMAVLAADESGVDVMGLAFGLSSMIIATVVVLFLIRTAADYRKAKLATDQDDQLRQLVSRYEQLSATSLDAQQRTAADVAEVRARLQAVEQILRTVDGG